MSPEEAFVGAFIAPSRRSRYLALLASRNGRERFVALLPHFGDLDLRYVRRVHPQSIPEHEAVYNELQRLGAPDRCYVISSLSSIDGQELQLKSVLADLNGRSGGTFLSCLSGNLGYFEGEEYRQRFILVRDR